MLNKESEILYSFAREPWTNFTFSSLMERKKSKSYLASVLKKFVDEKVLKKVLVGRLPVYSLNLSSAKSRVYAGFVLEHEGWNKKHIPYDSLLIDKIPTKDYVFLITGSYAKGKQSKESDIDAVIIIDDSVDPKKVYAELSHYAELNIPQIHLYVFRNREFIAMLKSREANYGKEIVKNNLILTGGQIYLELVEEAIENGFHG